MSDEAPRSRSGADVEALEDAILALLDGRDGSICPSEAARRVGGAGWRALMDVTREAGRRLAARGAIVVTQRGRVVDADRARGAIRYACAEGRCAR